MYSGAVDGCQLAPDPIWPIHIMFCWLRPTRMPISSSCKTISGPIFIWSLFISIPAIGDGLAAGMGIFISDAGDAAAGLGEAAGLFIPGISAFIGGDDEGDGEGEGFAIFIPGMASFVVSDGVGEGAGRDGSVSTGMSFGFCALTTSPLKTRIRPNKQAAWQAP